MTRIIFVCFILVGLFACDKTTTVSPLPDTIPVTEVQKIADMNQAFGWEVFHREMAANPKKNVLISPWSIQTALQMVANGAQVNTLKEVLAAIHCPDCDVAGINTEQAKLTTLLELQSGHPRLKTANALFYDAKRITVLEPYKQALKDHYGAAIENRDFSNSNDAVQEINSWVKQNTNGKIDQILQTIKQEDIAFLINALHFKADWKDAFPLQSTQNGNFKAADGTTVSVQMMHNDYGFTQAEGTTLRMIDLPFKDSTYSLTLVQPTVLNNSANWFQDVNAAAMQSLYAKAKTERALVYLPRFKMAYDAQLIETLKALGIKDAFQDARADFSGMGTSSGNIFINQIKHKSVLEIDEKGAEGAAVTSVGFGVTSVPPVFTFDQPFVLSLRHIKTNTLIFTGYVANPNAQ
jgi:serine protease inhibitor